MPRQARNTATQDNEAEPSNGVAHGDNGPTDAIILQFARSIIAKDVEVEEAHDVYKSLTGQRRNIVKQAKNAGLDTTELLRAVKDRQREPDDVKAALRNYLRFTNLFQMPTKQADLFPANAAPPLDPSSVEGRKQAVFDAGNLGLRAGKAGFEISACPFHQSEDSEEYQAWTTQWHAGQARLANGLTDRTARGQRSSASNPEDRVA